MTTAPRRHRGTRLRLRRADRQRRLRRRGRAVRGRRDHRRRRYAPVRGSKAVQRLYEATTRIYPETGTPRTKHQCTNLTVDVDEAAGTATARSYYTVLQQTPSLPLQPIISGPLPRRVQPGRRRVALHPPAHRRRPRRRRQPTPVDRSARQERKRVRRGVRTVHPGLRAGAGRPRHREGARRPPGRGRPRRVRRPPRLEVRVGHRAPRPPRVLATSRPATSYMGYLARATERIHLGSGIFNLSPRVNHPARNAERVAMLDHLTDGRFEFGTGRGAGSHEIGTFNIHDPNSTKAEWDEVAPRARRDVGAQGLHVQGRPLRHRRAPQHPPEALRQGASGHVGGVRQPGHVRQGRPPRHRRPRLQLLARSTTCSPRSSRTRTASPSARSRSASSSTTT